MSDQIIRTKWKRKPNSEIKKLSKEGVKYLAKKPLIAITAGDPASVGPEIVVKALSNKELYEKVKPVVICSKNVIEKALEITKVKISICPVEIDTLNRLEEKDFSFDKVFLIDLENASDNIPFGKISAEAGKAAFEYIKKAIELGRGTIRRRGSERDNSGH